MTDTGPGPLTLADYAERARAAVPVKTWDFIEGGAGDERTLRSNADAFERARLLPRVLAGVGLPDTGTRVLGRTWAAPVGVAPMAYHTLVHDQGEIATARAAGAAGLPFVVSTFAGRTFEDIAAAATSPLWLQVYCFRDRSLTRELIHRAERAGFEALVLTVDAPRLGSRLRDLRHGFTLPPTVRPANLEQSGTGFGSPMEHALAEFDAALDWSVIGWLRSVSSLPVLLKGVLGGADARRAVDAGVDGLIVSNHGGRQLDGAPSTLDALPEIASAVAGACPVLIDGGVRRGADVLTSLASGADAVLLGRPVLHGLAVGGEEGVARVLGLVADELTEAMALCGTASVSDAGPDLLAPRTALPAQGPSARDGLRGGEARTEEPRREEPRREEARGEEARTAKPRGEEARTEVLRRDDLHGSVRDPLLGTMNFLNEITSRYPEAISFAPGRPYGGFFRSEQIFDHLRRYLDHLTATGHSPDQVRDTVFQYGPTSGLIRDLVADTLRRDEGIDVPPESIVVTAGCQEAMLLAVRALIAGPDDVLLVPDPCYVGITGAARLLDVEAVAVPEHAGGFRCADLEAVLSAQRARGRRPRAFYVTPDHANPSGATMPVETRHELLALAARHDLLILEDSPYRSVSPGRQLPTLKSLDRTRSVVHLGSFSKTLFPGARIGFAVADQPVHGDGGGASLLADELAKIKSMVTVNTSAVSQAVVAGMLLAADGRPSDFNADTAAYYGNAMRTVLTRLEERFPPAERTALGIRWNTPTGGFFLTLDVPFPTDNAALTRSAEDFGVIWTPMSYFYLNQGGESALRLSISYLTPDSIKEGIDRLARFIKSESGTDGTS
ncbi:aminotransferase class I/II-fold pyridoxal phosphate-dependent enzyme [Streptomyces sp. NPDC054796]